MYKAVSEETIRELEKIVGKDGLIQDKEKMLAIIDRYHSLPPEDRLNFRVGRGVGIYTELDDLYDSNKRQAVEQFVQRLSRGSNEVDEETIFRLTARFI